MISLEFEKDSNFIWILHAISWKSQFFLYFEKLINFLRNIAQTCKILLKLTVNLLALVISSATQWSNNGRWMIGTLGTQSQLGRVVICSPGGQNSSTERGQRHFSQHPLHFASGHLVQRPLRAKKFKKLMHRLVWVQKSSKGWHFFYYISLKIQNLNFDFQKKKMRSKIS